MSFNLDDPLAGILSDNSDDSFFDDDILGKKKPNKQNTPIIEKKKTLFDLGQNKPNVVPDSNLKIDSHLNYDEKAKTTAPEPLVTSSAIDKAITLSPLKKVASKEPKIDYTKEMFNEFDIEKSPAKKIINVDSKNDIKPQAKPIDKGKSSQSLLDDILGASSSKSGISSKMQKTTITTKSQEIGLDLILGKTDSKTAPSLNKNATLKSKPVEDKVRKDISAKKTKTSEDWLGIFEEKDDIDTMSDMPSWLTGTDNNKDTKKRKPSKDEQKAVNEMVNKEETKGPTKTENDQEKENVLFESNLNQLMKPIPSTNILGNSNEDITAEGAVLFLQQQESQLAVALQLKAQEEKLATLQLRQKESQRVQREAEEAQHAQIEAMLRRQAEHRRQMQGIIAGHQERITKRIKDLLIGTNNTDDSNKDVGGGDETLEIEQRESPHGKEKRQLLQLVQSLQENHDKEIDLMETSYRRQLAFLEVSSNQAEERMKEESEKLVKFYTEKIHWLEEHHQLYRKLTEENLNSLSDRYKAESETFKQQHLENVKILQEHHAALMENIKNAVKQEQNLLKDSSSFSSSLTGLVDDVKESRSQCKELLEKVDALTETVRRDVEKSLQAREAQVNEMIQQLQRDREHFEKEKTESKDIVKMLESRLRQMTTMIEEEAASLKQKKMEFEFEKATFSKQSEFAKNVLKKQDEEMKMLKEDFIKEYQDKIAKIDDEKTKALKDSAIVATEKASMQSLKQELEKMKVELQAQFQELAEERSKLNLEKQQMHMEEQRIIAKSRDLEMLSKSAIQKQTESENKYSEAETLQRKYEERIQRIQEHVVSLNAREKQIAREKVALSRERLSLHNERKRFENNQQCSLCRSSQNIPYNEPTYTVPDTFVDVSVSRDNAELLSSPVNVIEQEMIRLMGRSFNHRTVPENDNSQERRYYNRDVINNFPIKDVKGDSGPFKDYMDPKFMMMRLDVKKVISNLDQNKKTEIDKVEKEIGGSEFENE